MTEFSFLAELSLLSIHLFSNTFFTLILCKQSLKSYWSEWQNRPSRELWTHRNSIQALETRHSC